MAPEALKFRTPMFIKERGFVLHGIQIVPTENCL